MLLHAGAAAAVLALAVAILASPAVILLDAARWATFMATTGMAAIGTATTGIGTAIPITSITMWSSSVASAFRGGGDGVGAGVRGGDGTRIHTAITVMAM